MPLYSNWATGDAAPGGHGLYVLKVNKWPWLKQPAYMHAISRKNGSCLVYLYPGALHTVYEKKILH